MGGRGPPWPGGGSLRDMCSIISCGIALGGSKERAASPSSRGVSYRRDLDEFVARQPKKEKGKYCQGCWEVRLTTSFATDVRNGLRLFNVGLAGTYQKVNITVLTT